MTHIVHKSSLVLVEVLDKVEELLPHATGSDIIEAFVKEAYGGTVKALPVENVSVSETEDGVVFTIPNEPSHIEGIARAISLYEYPEEEYGVAFERLLAYGLTKKAGKRGDEIFTLARKVHGVTMYQPMLPTGQVLYHRSSVGSLGKYHACVMNDATEHQEYVNLSNRDDHVTVEDLLMPVLYADKAKAGERALKDTERIVRKTRKRLMKYGQ